MMSGKKKTLAHDHPDDLVNEHLGLKRHKRIKENYKTRQQEGKQLTRFESEVRAKAKELKAEGAIHDFVRALSFSAISSHQADSYIGQVFVQLYEPRPCLSNFQESISQKCMSNT